MADIEKKQKKKKQNKYRFDTSRFSSARFWVILVLILTFCYLTIASLHLFSKQLENEKTIGVVREVVMFLLGAFTTQVGYVIGTYFNRTDRDKQTNGNGEEKPK